MTRKVVDYYTTRADGIRVVMYLHLTGIGVRIIDLNSDYEQREFLPFTQYPKLKETHVTQARWQTQKLSKEAHDMARQMCYEWVEPKGAKW